MVIMGNKNGADIKYRAGAGKTAINRKIFTAYHTIYYV